MYDYFMNDIKGKKIRWIPGEVFNNNEYLKVESALTGEDITNYLYSFKRESDFESRKNQAYYLNYLSNMVNSLSIPIYAQDIMRSGSNLYEAFINDVDRMGSTMSEFMLEFRKEQLAKGNAFIVMNNFTSFAPTEQEQIDLRQFPWIQLRKMHEVYKVENDIFGKIIRIEFYNGSKDDIIGYTATHTYTFKRNEEKETIKRKKNLTGVLPIIQATNHLSEYPRMNDVANTCISIYNQLSEQRDLERTQAFSLLEIPNDQPSDDVALGPDNIIWIPTNSSRGSAYISPDAAILKTLREAAQSTLDMLAQQAESNGITVVKGTQSGEALKMEFLGSSFILKEGAKWSENIEYQIGYLFNIYTIRDNNIEVIYDKEFLPGTTQIKNDLELIAQAKAVGIEFTPEELKIIKEDILENL